MITVVQALVRSLTEKRKTGLAHSQDFELLDPCVYLE